MKSTIITGLAAILLLAISCKKESATITDKSSALALTTDITEAAQKYTSTWIHGQQWMTTNLAVKHYRNGDRIPKVTNPAEWDTLTTGAWCWYNNDSANGAVYGRLYNWYAVHDPRGLAPAGWHVPSHAEWATLITHLGGNAVAGSKLKATGTIEAGTGLWYAPNWATNSSGFTALPGGMRYYYDGLFYRVGYYGYWWSSTEDIHEYSQAWAIVLQSTSIGIWLQDINMPDGLSVRCLRD